MKMGLQALKKMFNQHRWLYISTPGFAYGFLRGINAQYEPPDDVIGNKVTASMLNGIFYAYPVLFPYYITKLLSRIDVKLNGKDPEKYENIYKDMFCKNKNIFI